MGFNQAINLTGRGKGCTDKFLRGKLRCGFAAHRLLRGDSHVGLPPRRSMEQPSFPRGAAAGHQRLGARGLRGLLAQSQPRSGLLAPSLQLWSPAPAPVAELRPLGREGG